MDYLVLVTMETGYELPIIITDALNKINAIKTALGKLEPETQEATVGIRAIELYHEISKIQAE